MAHNPVNDRFAVTMVWNGGSSYALGDSERPEHFRSLRQAKAVFLSRLENRDGRTPCVDDSCSALIWRGHLTDTTDQYPDLEFTIGPRGGIRVSRV